MMDAEARLARALGASAAPPRDPVFTLAVIETAGAQNFRVEVTRAMLRAAGLAAAWALLVLVLANWTVVNWDDAQSGILGAGGIFALVAAARLMTQRLAAATTR